MVLAVLTLVTVGVEGFDVLLPLLNNPVTNELLRYVSGLERELLS